MSASHDIFPNSRSGALKMFRMFLLLPSILLWLLLPHESGAARGLNTFSLGKSDFLLNGKPFQIISGEMHYARIPKEYWRERLRMARAMGLNTISTYIFWTYHEREEGKFDFTTENRNVAEFVRIAQEEGLWVIIRPGPYVCAEWDFGGLPWWLLKDRNVKVRSADSGFLDACRNYFSRIGNELGPLQITNGGPIIMVQVENEYGSFGSDTTYLSAVRDDIRHAGFTVPLFTADGPGQCRFGHISGALPAINGDDSPESIRDTVKEWNNGSGPYFSPEFYPGWLDHWGEEHSVVSAGQFIGKYDTLLRNSISVSLYMFHGGTNFGFTSGANYGGHYQPQPTSYDYDAPLDEAGRPTQKYFLFRQLLRKYQSGNDSLPEVPPTNKVIKIPAISLRKTSDIFASLPKPILSPKPLSLEDVGQESGWVLYRTKIAAREKDTLILNGVRDYAVIMLNRKPIGSLDRRQKQKRLIFSSDPGDAQLDILVGEDGRINYGRELLDNRKGIVGDVMLNGTQLKGWQVFSLPMMDPTSRNYDNPDTSHVPAFHRGAFQCDDPGDTYLDLRGWGKGAVWLNGHNLGRFWHIGPQQTLYCPGVWLRNGMNDLIVFETDDRGTRSVEGLNEPILNELHPDAPPPPPHRPTGHLKLDNVDQITSGDFEPGDTEQTIRFREVTARFVCLETLSSLPNDPFASAAELYVLDARGRKIDRSQWKIYYVDSEELHAEDGRAENVFDDDPETIWHTEWGNAQPAHPHQLVIDIGTTHTIGGVVYQSRQGNLPGKIKEFKFYARSEPFEIRP